MITSLVSKAGEFRGTCRLGQWVIEADLPPGINMADLVSRWDKKLEANVFAVACVLDTTDRAEFEQHMKTKHDNGRYAYDGAGLKPDPPLRKTYAPRVPTPIKSDTLKRATAQGLPFKPSLKAIAAAVKTCTDCGLIAEVDSYTSELWWDEHRRGCAIAHAEDGAA